MKDLTNNKRIDNVEVSKSGNGYNLYYEVDGQPCNVTGEFYIDKDNVLHHDALVGDEEIEIKVQL